MTQAALFDLSAYAGPPDHLRRARELLALVEDLGSDGTLLGEPDAWWAGVAKAQAIATDFNAPKLLDAIRLLGDPDALSMRGFEDLEIEATRHARDLVEHLERERLTQRRA